MDTSTVLTIIEMIDIAHTNLDEHLNEQSTNADMEYLLGGMHQLSGLRNHLQEYIESQVSALENSAGE
jgi:hypothetical protein